MNEEIIRITSIKILSLNSATPTGYIFTTKAVEDIIKQFNEYKSLGNTWLVDLNTNSYEIDYPSVVGIAEDLYIKNNHLMCDIAFVNTPAGRLSKDKNLNMLLLGYAENGTMIDGLIIISSESNYKLYKLACYEDN